MFCPQCKAEYRPGFARCADCDVDLVNELPASASPELPHEPMAIVWSGDSQNECMDWCQWFKSLGIPFTVNQRRKQIWAGGIKEDYDILVPPDFVAQAKSEVEHSKLDSPDAEEQGATGVTKDTRNAGLHDDSAPLDPEPRDFRPWFPEDAVVEVFSELADDDENKQSSMIEASLRENLINSRTEESDATRRIFVVPEDEGRAREIVREVITGSPPE